MAHTDVILPAEPTAALPVVRSISPADLGDVLAKGLADFRAMPTHVIFLSLIYPIAGLAIARWTAGHDIVPLLYPLIAGFALIGPFAAIGLYELSRRRELGLDTSWRHAFDIVHSPSLWSILALGLLLVAIFGVWLAVAHGLYVAHFGEDERPIGLAELARRIFDTPQGRSLIVTGNAVGFLFALASFALSAVSFPLLLDRNVGMATAIVTSLRAILKNPVTMALWGLIGRRRPRARLAAVPVRAWRWSCPSSATPRGISTARSWCRTAVRALSSTPNPRRRAMLPISPRRCFLPLKK